MFVLSEYIYIYYFILLYIRRAILTQTNAKKGLIEKKAHQLYNLVIRKKYHICRLLVITFVIRNFTL
jgi:hypothetical protein